MVACSRLVNADYCRRDLKACVYQELRESIRKELLEPIDRSVELAQFDKFRENSISKLISFMKTSLYIKYRPVNQHPIASSFVAVFLSGMLFEIVCLLLLLLSYQSIDTCKQIKKLKHQYDNVCCNVHNSCNHLKTGNWRKQNSSAEYMPS